MADQDSKASGVRFKTGTSAGKMEEVHITISKTSADLFRRISKKTKYSSAALFEEMIDTYSHGIDWDKK